MLRQTHHLHSQSPITSFLQLDTQNDHNSPNRSDSPASLNMLTRAQLAREQALANNPPQATPPVQLQQQQTPAGLGDLGILPPEIRNRIYHLVLPQPERFNLQTYQPHGELQYVIDGKPTSRFAGQEVAPVDHKRKTEHRCQRRANNEWVQVPSSTALVQLNKQFQAETSSILYGSNKFEFTSTRALERFVIQIGENKKHLREVGLRWQPDGHDAVVGRRAMEALCAAKSLHTVSICGVPNHQRPGVQGEVHEAARLHVYAYCQVSPAEVPPEEPALSGCSGCTESRPTNSRVQAARVQEGLHRLVQDNLC
jgi:hypothetical protein